MAEALLEGVRAGLLVLANPRVVDAQGSEVVREGCLSIPDLTANGRRGAAVVVVVEAESPTGDRVEVETRASRRAAFSTRSTTWTASFLDRVDSLARDVFRRKRYRR